MKTAVAKSDRNEVRRSADLAGDWDTGRSIAFLRRPNGAADIGDNSNDLTMAAVGPSANVGHQPAGRPTSPETVPN